MKTWAVLVWSVLVGANVFAQGFELVEKQDFYQSPTSQTLRIPLQIRNTSDKPQVYVIRKIQDDLNSTQKGYFCIDKNCQEPGADEFTRRLEAGETLQNLSFTLETGLLAGQHTIRFEIFPRGMVHQAIERPINITIEEKSARALVFQSRDITVHDVYPNPVLDQGSIEYDLHSDQVKAKLVIYNILGKPVGDFELRQSESKVKIATEDLPSGVYFYTLYINNDGVFTRKLIVRK